MEPVTLLVSTLALGAAAALKETAGEAVRDAYSALKTLIVKKFGPQPAIDSLERTPGSAKKREAAEEDLATAADDDAVIKVAEDLANVVKRDDPKVGEIVGVSIDDVVAKFLDIEGIRSSGSGVLVQSSKFQEGVTIKDVVADSVDPSRP